MNKLGNKLILADIGLLESVLDAFLKCSAWILNSRSRAQQNTKSAWNQV